MVKPNNISYNNFVKNSGLDLNTVRVGAYVDFPYAAECFENVPNSCKSPGIEIEYAYTLIREMLHFNVNWRKFANLTELENAMDNNAIDFIGVMLKLESKYAAKWYHTHIVSYDLPGFITKTNKIYNFDLSMFQLLHVFSWSLWLLLLLVSLVTVVLKYTATYMKKNLMFISENRCNGNGIRNVFYTWCFIVVGIILNMFGNLIAVELLARKHENAPFNNLVELGKLVSDGKCKLATLEVYKDDSTFYSSVLYPIHNKSWSSYFRHAYFKNPPFYVMDRKSLANLVENGDCIVGVDWTTLEEYYSKRFCNIKMISFYQEFIDTMYVYYHRINNFTDTLNKIMMTDSMFNFYPVLTKKYSSRRSTACDVKHPEKEGIPAEKLEDCFLTLLFGTCIAFTCFMFQCATKHCDCRRRRLDPAIAL